MTHPVEGKGYSSEENLVDQFLQALDVPIAKRPKRIRLSNGDEVVKVDSPGINYRLVPADTPRRGTAQPSGPAKGPKAA